MEIKYNFTKTDFRKFQTSRTFKSRGFLVFFLAILLFIGYQLWTILGDKFSVFVTAIIVSILLTLLILLLFLFSLLVTIISAHFGKHDGIITQHLVRIDENGFFEETHLNSTLHRWQAVFNIEQDRSYIYVFVNRIMLHVIPKKAFESEAEANKFYDLANQYWEEAKISG